MHPVLAFLSSLWHSLLTMLSSLFGQQNEPEPQQKVDHDRIASSEKQITSPEPNIKKVKPKNGMERLIEVINKLQEACAEVSDDLQYDLPQIAVVGCQSAGKSSVLENIVGRDFLPRGTGVVTRRPLILQLFYQPGQEYGEFAHIKDKKFTNFNEIRDEIAADTDRVAGANKGMSKDPISLRIYSPNVPNLTLIDLPGLTKVPIGDQPDDIEQQTRDMILNFIVKENCLILAVTPANTDLANSDALKLAREVDEKGERTIGVITKCDLMDKGTDCRDILDNNVFPLHRGYVGVVNRSQSDIEGRKRIQDAQKAEAGFFENHLSYRSISSRLGTPYLQLVLTQQLSEHIRKHLPALQDKLEKQKVSLKEEVKRMTELYPADALSMSKTLGIVIDKLKTDFRKEIGDLGAELIETERLSLGTKINEVFFDRFPKLLSKISCDEQELREKIDRAIRNTNGVRPCLNTPQTAFESIVQQEISRLNKPIRECVDLVVNLLLDAVRACTQNMAHYPKIRNDIEARIIDHVYSVRPGQEESVLALLDIEIAYQNTNHEDFKPTNDIERQGILYIEQMKNEARGESSGEGEPYWFVLTSKTLSCYDNDSHDVDKFTFALNGFKIREISEHNTIELFNQNSEICKRLRLYCEDDDAFDAWKESFEWVLNKSGKKLLGTNLKFKKDVNECHEKIIKYMIIVKKTARDMVPKAIKHYIIDELKNYIHIDLAPILNSKENLADMFQMDSDQAEKLDRKKIILATYKKALTKIRSIPMHST